MATSEPGPSPLHHRLRRFHTRLRRAGARVRFLRILAEPDSSVDTELDHFLDEARAAGTVVLDARAEPGVAVPYALARAWLEAAGLQAPGLAAGELASALDEEGSQSTGEALLGLWERLRRALQSAARERVLLLVGRDIHRADPDMRALLAYLGERLRFAEGGVESRHGLVTVSRGGASCGPWPPAELMESLEIAVDPEEAVERVFADPALRARLLALAGGRAEALRALLGSLDEAGLAALQDSALARLPEGGRAALEVLALLGRSAPEGLLARVLRRPPDELAGALAALVATGRLVRQGDRFALSPEMDPEALRVACDEERRCRWHAAIALALASGDVAGEARVALDEERARHLLLAGESELGMSLALAVAQELGERGAPRRALALLDFAGRGGAGPGRARALDAVRADLLERLGELDEALALRRRLLAGSRDDEERAAGAWRMGTLLLRQGAATEAIRLLEEGQRAAEHGESLPRLRLAASLAESHLRLGDASRAEEIAREALVEALAEGSPAGLIVVANVLGKAQAATGAAAAAERSFRHALAGARRLERPREEARAHYNLGVLALGRGAVVEAGEHFAASLAHSEACGEPMGAALALTNLAVVRAQQGRLGEAIGAMQRAVAGFEDLGMGERLSVALSDLAGLLLVAGDLRGAARAAARGGQLAASLAQEGLAAHCALREAEVALEQGHLTRAERALRDAERRFTEAGAVLDRGWTLLGLARVAEERREVGDAIAHLESLDSLGLGEETELAPLALLVRARLWRMQGQEDAAEAALDAALPLLEAVGRPVELAEALHRKAAMVAEAGEAEVAERMRGEAQAIVREIEATLPESIRAAFRARRVVARVLAPAFAEVGARPPAPRGPAQGVVAPVPGVPAPVERDEWRRRFPEILGESRATRRVLQMIDRFAAVDSTIVVLGESGTGKELVARALYRLSPRRRRAFVRINAAALSESLLLSELFGHERGAFTGAERQVKGAFERAHGGTLFLDEIGDISPAAQVSLLRVLQEREVLRVGGTRPIHVDVRVICATNRDLEQLVAEGRFRLDLYHRIRGLTIEVPPLRERPEDIGPIAMATLAEVSVELGHPVEIGPEALALLKAQPWSGNVRELQNVLRSTAVLSDGPLLGVRELVRHAGLDPGAVATARPSQGSSAEGALAAWLGEGEEAMSLSEAKRELEVTCIKRALARAGGNITHAAPLLGMKRPRLSQKIKELGIVVPR